MNSQRGSRITVSAAAMALVAGAAGSLWAQPDQASPATFDVVSVKPHAMPAGSVMFRFSAGGPLRVRGNTFNPGIVTLSDLILDAYDVKAYQLSGLPAWALSPAGDHFDVVAKSEQEPTPAQLRQMLQTLLADRFQLKLHRETRELPVYALTVGKGGSKLRELSEDEKAAAKAPAAPRSSRAVESVQNSAPMKSTIPMLVSLIANVVDRPVVDRTGLAGTYEYPRLDWREFAQELRGTASETGGQSVFAAVQEELGLKLEPRREATEILVIDRVEKPSAN